MTYEQMQQVESAFHDLLKEKFLEAKAQDAPGQFTIEITASGHINSRSIQIETKVSIGNWPDEGKMKATTISQAFPIAMERAGVNKIYEPKLLTLECPPEPAKELSTFDDEIPF